MFIGKEFSDFLDEDPKKFNLNYELMKKKIFSAGFAAYIANPLVTLPAVALGSAILSPLSTPQPDDIPTPDNTEEVESN